jgi:hypothetical protein
LKSSENSHLRPRSRSSPMCDAWETVAGEKNLGGWWAFQRDVIYPEWINENATPMNVPNPT